MKKLLTAIAILLIATSCEKKAEEKAEVKPKAVNETSLNLSEGKTVHLNKAQFIANVFDYETATAWNYKGTVPCIIDFYADWCGPCKAAAPVLDELAKEYAGKVIIYKINVDDEPELAGAFGVQSIPTFFFIPMKGEPAMAAGIGKSAEETKAMFKEKIELIINNK